MDGWPAGVDYPLPGESRVFFVKRLRPGLREPCVPGSARAIDFADVFKLDRAG